MILSRLAGRDNRHATGRCVDPGSRQSSVLFGSCLRITSRHRGMAIDAGFSLVEVMLSLTLAILLLGAIYAAIGQSRRITASGREEITRSQVARAVIRIMTTDVRSVMFVASGVVEDEANDSEDTSSAETTTSVVTEPGATSIGIRGTANQLELHLSQARRDWNFMSHPVGNNVGPRTSDLKAVTYHVETTSGVEGGLIRTEGDRLTVQAVEEKGGFAAQASSSQRLAPEIQSLTFRYFAGSGWHLSWDSVIAGYLPRAIEVSITFRPVENQAGILTNVAVSSSSNQFRTVIVVPTADPLPPELQP